MSNSNPKKSFYKKVLTIYGRNPAIEALSDNSLTIHRLHLANSNKPSKQLDKIISLAKARGIEIKTHTKRELSFISKNSRQDQGVALDIILDNLLTTKEFLNKNSSYKILALDGITNPQNVGMIIRSAVAGDIDAILLSDKRSAPLVSPLSIKASSGTLFKIPIIKSSNLAKSLREFKDSNTKIYTLDSHAKVSFKEIRVAKRAIFVLGNETSGVSKEIKELSDIAISIPMQRGVESLNVAVSASLIALCI